MSRVPSQWKVDPARPRNSSGFSGVTINPLAQIFMAPQIVQAPFSIHRDDSHPNVLKLAPMKSAQNLSRLTIARQCAETGNLHVWLPVSSFPQSTNRGGTSVNKNHELSSYVGRVLATTMAWRAGLLSTNTVLLEKYSAHFRADGLLCFGQTAAMHLRATQAAEICRSGSRHV